MRRRTAGTSRSARPAPACRRAACAAARRSAARELAARARRSAPAVVLKSVISDFSCRGCGRAPRRSRRRCRCSPRGRAGLRAQRRVGDDRAVPVGRLPVRDRAVVARAALPVRPEDSSCRSACRSLRVSAPAAREDLVELDRRAGLVDRDRVAVVELGARRRAGLQVDEEVALEEDARADRHRGVLVDRQALLVDPHRHERGLLAVLDVLDLGDLADVDAGDPHRRARARRCWPSGRRPGSCSGAERDRLGEAEVGADGEQDEREQRRPGRRHAACAALRLIARPSRCRRRGRPGRSVKVWPAGTRSGFRPWPLPSCRTARRSGRARPVPGAVGRRRAGTGRP